MVLKDIHKGDFDVLGCKYRPHSSLTRGKEDQ